MLDLAGFRARYEEFSETSDALVTAVLLEQQSNVADNWGTRENEVHGLRTAHALAQSPAGKQQRLVDKEGKSTYSRRLWPLIVSHGCGLNRAVTPAVL